MNSLAQPAPAPIGPVVASGLAKLLPEEVALDTLNSQYLQLHSTSAAAILAAAEASHTLSAPLEEVENITFAVLNPEVDLTVKVGCTLPVEFTYIYVFTEDGLECPCIPEPDPKFQSRRIQVFLRRKVRALHSI